MAKLTGPFFSLKASGQLGKTLVAFPWKGINALRTYVIPANPRSDAQTTQRGFFIDAVEEWHGAAYNALDVGAWNRFAGILAKIMSGFNAMIKTFVDEAILGNAWERIHGVWIQTITTTTLRIRLEKVAAGNTPTLNYGTRKTHFPKTMPAEDMGGGYWVFDVEGLTKDTLYYFYIDVGTPASDYGRTGIYSQRTAAT